MFKKKIKLDLEAFFCPICRNLMKNPVTVPCGHSYCMRCIKDHLNEEDVRRLYSCPQCGKDFTPRPALVKNIVCTKLLEELRETDLHEHLCYARAEDVSCDVCSDMKLKAVKSCLNCLASYCEKHLRPHYEAPPLQKHQLVEPSKTLQENICPRHDEVMKIFCRTDQQCICYLCLMDEHKGHETVPVSAGRAEKQKELDEIRQQIQQRFQEREKDVKLLQQEVEAINVSADKTVKDNQKMFSELIKLIKEKRLEAKQRVVSQKEYEVSRVKALQQKLEQEMTELKRKDVQLEQLSHTEDHNQFLHNYPSVSALSESPHSSSIKTRPLRYFEDVTAAVEELRDKIQDVLRDTWTNVSLKVSEVDALLSEPELKTRDEFLKLSQEITLDPNTAHRQLVLSEENRKVTLMTHHQPYPDHPDRFSYFQQVLSRESLSGRCYFEVEWSGRAAYFAVSYKDLSRDRSSLSKFGFSDKTWAFSCLSNSYVFWHKNTCTPVSGPDSSRIGVYLDHRAGILSFYSVSDTMTLLHRVQTTFTQPLHAGVWLIGCGTTVEFIKTQNRD